MRRTVFGSATKFWPRSRRGARPWLARARAPRREDGSSDRPDRPARPASERHWRISTSIGAALGRRSWRSGGAHHQLALRLVDRAQRRVHVIEWPLSTFTTLTWLPPATPL